MKYRKPSLSGVALVIVLGFLVLISVLAVAFFTSVSTELKASRNFQSEVTTHQLADSALQMVIGQISTATTQPHEAWASQPGLIRVFGNAGKASASLDSFYKLYSSNVMTVPSASMGTYVPTTDYNVSWDQNPATWTDLNAPVMVYDPDPTVQAVVPRFPIVDPRAYSDPTITVANGAPYTGTYGQNWQNNGVEGFLYDTTVKVDGMVGPSGPSAANNQRLPMPVQWIYVLQDGTLTAPTSGAGATANFSYGDGRQPTQQNPIVGRIAFWTDDETSKLNVNTAAGFFDGPGQFTNNGQNPQMQYYNATNYAGSYWDSPRYYTQFDYGIPNTVGMPAASQASGGLAICQLLQNEFQRYPGHPATTSLAPAFNSMYRFGGQPVNYFTSEQLYGLVPRYSNFNISGAQGSTKGGTVRVAVNNTASTASNPTPGTGNTLQFDQLQPKTDRLYASVDELFYGAHGFTSAVPYSRKDNISYVTSVELSAPAISTTQWAQAVDQSRFFVTAASRAPELNLYGQPRVSAWPIRYENNTEATGMNVFDNLILFCSTIGTPTVTPPASGRPDTTVTPATSGLYRYIFTRREILGGTATTQVGATGLFANQWTTNSTYLPDFQQARNSYLLGTYLPQFFNPLTPIPGFGTVWGAKYTANADTQQLLTEIFDYIRCANSQDTTTSISNQAPSTGKPIQFAPQGYIMPSTPIFPGSSTPAKGLGRMSTLCEASLVFYYAGPVMTSPSSPKTEGNWVNSSWSKWDPANPASRFVQTYQAGNVVTTGVAGTTHQKQMRAFLLFSTFDPMQGYAPKNDSNSTIWTVDGANGLGTPTSSPALYTKCPKMTIAGTFSTGATDWMVNVGNGNQTLGFPTTQVSTTVYRAPGSYWGGRNFGGYEGFMHTLLGDGGSGTTFRHKIMLTSSSFLTPAGTGSPPASGDYGETYDALSNTVYYNGFTNVPASASNQEYYPFQSALASVVKCPTTATTFSFTGGGITVNLYYGGNFLQSFSLNFPASSKNSPWPIPSGGPGDQDDPNGGQGTLAVVGTNPAKTAASADVTTWNATTDTPNYGAGGYSTSGATNTMPANGLGGVTAFTSPANPGAQGMAQWYWLGNGAFFQPGIKSRKAQTAYGINAAGVVNGSGTSLQAAWSFSTRLAWCEIGGGNSNNPSYAAPPNNTTPTGWTGGAPNLTSANTATSAFGGRWQCIVQPCDTIRSILYWDQDNGNTGALMSGGVTLPLHGGDLRVGALLGSNITSPVVSTNFMPHPDYLTGASRACVLRGGDGFFYFPNGQSPAQGGTTYVSPAKVLAASGNMFKEATLGNHISISSSCVNPTTNRTATIAPSGAFGNLPASGGTTANVIVNGVNRADFYPGDWDQGLGNFPDGPFCNKQDEGNVIYEVLDPNTNQYYYPIPYFTWTNSYQQPGDSFTSPCRQMPSPVMFGSLPSHVLENHNWETLCFCPNPAGYNNSYSGNSNGVSFGHPGNSIDPKDHLLLDLFMMPVVEPYPISEPFSTAGKVNLNYHIAPFDYIRRSTALRGALYPIRVTAVPSGGTSSYSTSLNFLTYKTGFPAGTPITSNFRTLLDRDATIQELDAVYESANSLQNWSGSVFKAASQICEQFLVPYEGAQPLNWSGSGGVATAEAWWKTNGDLTGDNEREKPYADLYNRITTKSNTYTVHMKVQTLRQIPRGTSGAYNVWNEGKDTVLGEYRGSATIERYLDPADPRIGTGTYNGAPQTSPDSQSLEPLYRFRTVLTKKFSP